MFVCLSPCYLFETHQKYLNSGDCTSVSNRPFPLRRSICDVMSEVPQNACWSEFSVMLYTRTWPTFRQLLLMYRKNPEQSRRRSRVPASVFSTVLVRTPCDFLGHQILNAEGHVIITKCLMI